MKKIIHINQHNIKHNRKNSAKKKVITCKTYKSNLYCNELEILDKNGEVAAKLIYRPDKPLSCGATVWIETNNEVKEKI